MCVCVCVCVCECVCAPPDVCSLQLNHSRSLIRSSLQTRHSSEGRFLMHTLLYVLTFSFPLLPSAVPARESVNVPPSLFWRHVAADSLPTKLRKLTSYHSTKAKTKTPSLPYWSNTRSDTLTHILIHSYSHFHFQEGPDWIHHEDWILLKE